MSLKPLDAELSSVRVVVPCECLSRLGGKVTDVVSTARGSFRRGLLVGLIGDMAIVALVVVGVFLAGHFGGEGGATVAGLTLIPALVTLALAWLVIEVIIIVIPPLRARAGSGVGLLLGWLIGTVLVTVALAILFNIR
jgi:hypothetical protein